MDRGHHRREEGQQLRKGAARVEGEGRGPRAGAGGRQVRGQELQLRGLQDEGRHGGHQRPAQHRAQVLKKIDIMKSFECFRKLQIFFYKNKYFFTNKYFYTVQGEQEPG